MKIGNATSLVTLLLSATVFSAPVFAQNTTSLKHTLVLEDLENPWDMAFLDDGTMFYTEKCKGLSVLMPSGETKALLGMGGSEGFASTADDLFCEGQAGMMGVAIDPNFANNRRIYVYSTSNISTPHTNRLMRLEVSDDFSNVSGRTDIVDDVPYKMKPRTIRSVARELIMVGGCVSTRATDIST
ncbi:PQQ-dependent sugar dehydrogenase [Labrenzia sp. DG1229]|uniref:PQQ-dependent sugar dehydrogenase n=1 Tax=Labrenzia sp. DG1229 TaxID=681847 RepID=UPI000A96F806|nr:PQQ-dependent sugar dehydrogenase [Labrenzia sp. DG1229]